MPSMNDHCNPSGSRQGRLGMHSSMASCKAAIAGLGHGRPGRPAQSAGSSQLRDIPHNQHEHGPDGHSAPGWAGLRPLPSPVAHASQLRDSGDSHTDCLRLQQLRARSGPRFILCLDSGTR